MLAQRAQKSFDTTEKINHKKMHNSKNVHVINKSDEPITKLSYKQKFALEQLPKKMQALTEEIEIIEKTLSDSQIYLKDLSKAKELGELLKQKKQKYSLYEEEWLQLEILREELENRKNHS